MPFHGRNCRRPLSGLVGELKVGAGGGLVCALPLKLNTSMKGQERFSMEETVGLLLSGLVGELKVGAGSGLVCALPLKLNTSLKGRVRGERYFIRERNVRTRILSRRGFSCCGKEGAWDNFTEGQNSLHARTLSRATTKEESDALNLTGIIIYCTVYNLLSKTWIEFTNCFS